MRQYPMLRAVLAGLTIVVFTGDSTRAQQPAPQQPAAAQGVPVQQPAVQPLPPVQAPEGFQLNQLQQGELDVVLNAWQHESAKIVTFKCDFQRWEYDPVFGPQNGNQAIPLNKNEGELSYHRPDKGSFQIKKVKLFQVPPAVPGQRPTEQPAGDWIEQPDAIGEHWVCDGKSVFEYRHNQKQLVERPIPPQLQGAGIADGPLPFLFGAEAAKLKARYWMRIEQEKNKDPNLIWIVARPRFQEQAADFSEVDVMLDRQRLLPTAMQVHMPNASRHMYLFDIPNAKVNAALARLGAFFDRPRVPLGWKQVVEEMPVQQAAQPVPPAR